MTSTVAGNLDSVRQRLRLACLRAGRPEGSITLVAVTKFHQPGTIRTAAGLGLKHFGESRLQEAERKLPELAGLGEWHFIGHVQTNKAKAVAALFDAVQSVDSLRLAEKLSQAALELGKTLAVFAQVNISGEAQKHGFSLAEAPDAAARIAALPGLRLEGLMGMAAALSDPEDARPSFEALRRLRERLGPGLGTLKLSMGMSHDFEAAIVEGADLIRIGTALFEGTD